MPGIRIFHFLFALLAALFFAQADMVLVEGGTFKMGSANGEDDETPVHAVTAGNFYMGKYVAWEYAGGNNLDDLAWYRGNSGDKTHPAGTKQPSSLGLYDMNGNMQE
jgi:formylglycine-generating enzyme required for sulfatase activity